MGRVEQYIEALKILGDGRYHYWDGRPNGIGCSEYTRLALVKAGIIKEGETFHAASGILGPLADKSRFQCLSWNPNSLRAGDILWSNGHHVATWDGNNGVYEAAPQDSHGICDNGKTGVGHWSKHTYYNCGTGTYTWSCIYRIIPAMTKEGVEKVTGKLDAFIEALPVIKQGTTGELAKILQIELKRLGFYTGDLDGSVGPMTVQAIKDFQKKSGLGADGLFGPKSWAKLLK